MTSVDNTIRLGSYKITKDILGYITWYIFNFPTMSKTCVPAQSQPALRWSRFWAIKCQTFQQDIPFLYLKQYNLEVPIFAKNVLWFDVKVDNISLMQILNSWEVENHQQSLNKKLCNCLQESYEPSKICPTKPATSLSVKSWVEEKFKKYWF